MTQPSIGTDLNISLDIVCDIAAKITFNTIPLIDHAADIDNLFVSKDICFLSWIHTCLDENFEGTRPANSIDVGQADFYSLVSGQLNASNARHNDSLFSNFFDYSPLSLFVPWVLTDNPDHPSTPNDLTFSTNTFY
jgi:hypothetical protein